MIHFEKNEEFMKIRAFREFQPARYFILPTKFLDKEVLTKASCVFATKNAFLDRGNKVKNILSCTIV